LLLEITPVTNCGMEINDQIQSFRSLLNQFSLIRDQVMTQYSENLESVLSNSKSISETIKEENRKTSFLFNPLLFFSIGETTHSFLLASLLDRKGNHGQGDLFLKLFLQKFEIECFENDQWIVTAEKGRIDILLKRKHPKSVVIIENKSNNAVDQDCQLYRYWFREMYLPNKDLPFDHTLKDRAHYRIFYLSRDQRKIPQSYSLKKPQDLNLSFYPSLPEELKEEDIQKIFFTNEITDWLKDCLKEIEPENHRLREYIMQYIEIWKS
jgi:hypothetical protein